MVHACAHFRDGNVRCVSCSFPGQLKQTLWLKWVLTRLFVLIPAAKLLLRVLCATGTLIVISILLPTGLGEAILFCPKMLYNQLTAQYVLWFNWIEGANFAASYYAVATSKSLLGPYTLVVKQVHPLMFPFLGFSLGAGSRFLAAGVTIDAAASVEHMRRQLARTAR